jgi:hypothetical protein
VRTTKRDKTSKTEKTENIYTGGASPDETEVLDESAGNDAVKTETSGEETTIPPQPPRTSDADPLTAGTPTPEWTPSTPAAIDTRVRHNGNGQMIKPDLPTLTAFMLEKGGTPAMAETMFDFYASKGWLVGKSPMKDWNAAARKWIRENPPNAASGNRSGPGSTHSKPNTSTTAPMPTHQTKIR